MNAGTKVLLLVLILISMFGLVISIHQYLKPPAKYYFRWTGQVFGPYLSKEDCDYSRDWTLDLKDRDKAKDFAPCETR